MSDTPFSFKSYFYYRNLTSGLLKDSYNEIYKGLGQRESIIRLPCKLSSDKLRGIYSYVLNDCPQFFHVDSSFSYTDGGTFTLLRPHYICEGAILNENKKKVQDFLSSSRETLAGRSPLEKVKLLHDSIVKHVIYCETGHSSHCILGTLLDRKATCESIAKAFKILCDIALIPCIYVTGESNGNISLSESGHAWNMVYLNKRWYQMDVTFDTTLSDYQKTKLIRYDYYCRSDQIFAKNHRIGSCNFPSCPEDFDMYKRLALYVEKISDIDRIVHDATSSGQKAIVFQYDPGRICAPALIEHRLSHVLGLTIGSDSFSFSVDEDLSVFFVLFR